MLPIAGVSPSFEVAKKVELVGRSSVVQGTQQLKLLCQAQTFEGVDIMNVDEDGGWEIPLDVKSCMNSSLHIAVRKQSRPLVKESLYSGVPVDATDHSGVTALILASVTNHLGIVQILLEAGANPNICSSDFGTALHAACFGGHLPLVDLLIRGGANVNIRGPANQSCLFLAALKGHIKIVKVLLQKHAVLDNQDQLGLTALHAAIIEGHAETALYLIQEGASVNRQDSKGNLPLHYAVKGKQLSVIKSLVKAGCDTECCNYSFETPLLIAVRIGHLPTLVLLIQLGCEVNSSKPDGNCPIHTLVSKYDNSYPLNFEQVLKILLLAGCDINAQAFSTLETPLYRALSFCNSQVAETLLVYGANPNLSSPFDITALHLAFKKKMPRMVEMMLNSGIDMSRERWINHVPLSHDGESQKLITEVIKRKKEPISLVKLCRIAYRKNRKYLFKDLSYRSDIPLSVKKYILFSDLSLSEKSECFNGTFYQDIAENYVGVDAESEAMQGSVTCRKNNLLDI